MTKAYGYARISFDQHDSQVGVTNQRNSITAYAEQHNLELVKIFEDNNVSATKKIQRPQFEELMKLPEGSTIICFANDRLCRKPTDLERVLDREFTVYQVSAGSLPIDLSTPAGKLQARLLVAFAAMEGDQRRVRMAQATEASFKAGKPYNSNASRSFGNNKDGTINAEGEALRELVPQLLDREITISDMATELNNRKLFTAKNQQPWIRNVLSRALKNPKLKGVRVYKDEEIRLENWEPVLTDEQFEDLQIYFSENRSKYTRPNQKKHDSAHLLSGIATCGICGYTLYPTRAHRKGITYLGYACPVPKHVRMTQKVMDRVIMEELRLLLLADAESADGEKETARTTIRSLRKERAKLEESWAEWIAEATEELLPPSTIRKAEEAHQAKVEAIDAQISGLSAASLFGDIFPMDEGTTASEISKRVDEAIDAMPLVKRRALTEELFDEIVLEPFKGKNADPGRVRYTLSAHGKKLTDTLSSVPNDEE